MKKFRQLAAQVRQLAAQGFNWFWLGKSTVLLVVAAIVSAIVSLCYAHGDEELLSARWIAIAGGFLAGAVLHQTMRRAEAAEKATVQTEKSIVQKTFSDAITHLGHERESVILGGIHSLLNLAKENNDYRYEVFHILCAHIKTITTAGGYSEKYKKGPSTTIQTLLDLLFIEKNTIFFQEYNADLKGAYLAGSHLFRARLQCAHLQTANLQDAKLQNARLQKALLLSAKLQGAELQETQLQGANLEQAQLQGAKLQETKLQGADLTGADLQRATLQETQMQGAHMHNTYLPHKTQLGRSDLRGVSSNEFETLMKFKERIESRIGKETDLDGVVWGG